MLSVLTNERKRGREKETKGEKERGKKERKRGREKKGILIS